jgi:NADPH:quinone reductase-like Zn-dependent oxidoreductase
MSNAHNSMPEVPARMRAIRLHSSDGPAGLVYEQVDTPRPKEGEVLVRVFAAAITRGELDWPTDRLPAIPS